MPTVVQPRAVAPAPSARPGLSPTPAPTPTLARALPLTTGLLGLTLAVGAATGALWGGAAAQSLAAEQGYGLPAIGSGRWWTLLSGSPLVPDLRAEVAVAVAVVVLAGFGERVLGTLRGLGVLVACHVAGVLLAAAALAGAASAGWDWAADVAVDLDLGPQTGLFGLAAVATAGLSQPWRGRLRLALVGWVGMALLYAGGLAQVEHAAAVAVGLAAGPMCVGRPLRLRVRPSLHPLTRRDHRRLGSGLLAMSGVAAVVSSLNPVSGPLTGPEPSVRVLAVHAAHLVPGGALLHGITFLALARVVHRGSRRGWWLAVAVTTVVTWGQVAVAAGLVATDHSCWPVLVDNAALDVVVLGVLLAGHRACAVPSRRRAGMLRGSLLRPADAAERDAAVRCLTSHGASSRLAWMTTWPENRWFERDGGYLAHRVHAGVALGVGDPVGTSDPEQLLAAFAHQARREGLVPCLFAATEQTRQAAHRLGWTSLQVAEEAVIDLSTLDFRGRAWQDVRTALNQAAKRGIEVHLGTLAELPAGWRRQVEAISARWVEDKGLPELGFTLGGVEEALDPHVRVSLAVDADGVVHGVTSWLPIHRPGDGQLVGWTLDVMRRRPDGFRGVMELLIARTCLELRDEGCAVVSLSAAPLARTAQTSPRRPVEAFLDRLGAQLEPLYGFRSLQGFKAKFQPRTEPLHLLYPDEAALPRIGVALTRAYLPSTGWVELAGLLRHARSGRPPAVHDRVGNSPPLT
jgi:lysylphosphatidylglycerol synthetase-like protein (DUF2156 family)